MDYDTCLKRLSERGEPRGADRVFSTAASQARFAFPTASNGRRNRVGAGFAVAAVVTAVVAIGVQFLGGNGRVEVVTQPGAGTDAAKTTPSGAADSLGLRIIEGVDQDATAIWPGPVGDLRVFRSIDETGTRVTAVLAVAVSSPSEQTVLDQLHTVPDSRQVQSLTNRTTGGRSVTKAKLKGTSLDTFNQFDVARWTDQSGQTVTVAWYGVTPQDANSFIDQLTVDSGTAVVQAQAVPAGLVEVVSDPRITPLTPNGVELWATYRDSNQHGYTVGISHEPLPKASEVLWWNSDARLVDDNTLFIPGSYLYRSTPSETLIISSPDKVSDSDLVAVANALAGRSTDEWRTEFSTATTQKERVATTSTIDGG